MARVSLSRILNHLRRGKCTELWDALLAEADARLELVKHAALERDRLRPSPGAPPSISGADAKEEGLKKAGKRAGAKSSTSPAFNNNDILAAEEALRHSRRSLARIVSLVAQAVHFFR